MTKDRRTEQQPASAARESSTHSAQNHEPIRQQRNQPNGNEGDRERSISVGRETGGRSTAVTGGGEQRSSAPGQDRMGDPFSLMQRMAEDMDRLFEHFGFGRTGFMLSPSLGMFGDQALWNDDFAKRALWTPAVEVAQRGDKLVVRADLPGVKKEDLHVEVQNDMLSLWGERREQHEEKGDGFYRTERQYGRFSRAIPLPEGVNPDSVEATFSDGVLEVTVPAPKQQASSSRRIQIR
jgi:HSP20 family protein